ncbi:hypothetical protein N8E89_09295 [Phyllobacterium sp. A18/5-2]|uniref:hypothetical protein n=1 Tax=Phyllobacterium sp. A18/5-2 TaxID=2978392 RepID=UPI0021C680AF|nr:hypothetical protein [Phyllobacterium sp. A18/5-2]UXN62910.1 hypothetical protein N8E89_09295 [Phyllobacterium sp. A18/5-2]
MISPTSPEHPSKSATSLKRLWSSGKVSVEAQQKLAQLTTFINGVGDAAGNQVGQIGALSKAISTLAGIALPALSDMEAATKAYTDGLANAKTVEERIALGKAFGDAQRRISSSLMPTPEDKPNRESIAPEKVTKPKRTAADKARDKEVRDTERQAKAVTDLIDQLTFENSIIGMTAVEREKAIELRRVEKGATEEQRAQISGLIDAQYAEKESLAQVTEQMAMLSDLGRDTLGGFISDLIEGKSATEALGNALARVGDQLLNSGLDQLFGTGGKSGGFGLLGSLLGIGGGGGFAGGGNLNYFPPIPGFASGTRSAPGGLAMVGERGPELVNLPKGSQVTPHAPSMRALKGSGGTSVTFAPVIDARGASVEAVARLEQVVAKQQREFKANVLTTMTTAKKTRQWV